LKIAGDAAPDGQVLDRPEACTLCQKHIDKLTKVTTDR
jgi:hypothetical protein